ncbi:hypothetical protein LAG90_08660 [Marinilongibacter aquaticus]|uniref:fibronectin type III domain-containing protein n=1 Tax=Marinilongibacter aquaticus TaxID=2975157 RepID=UPI0021BD0773|nr:hypothetical protein [Marinilongibacter aquaticus]UBM60705.1 hypothetical protein LAG90_08660 [Marinilongibacter aquaticus]
MIRRIYTLIAACFFTFFVHAQNKEIGFVAKVDSEKVVLRWMPLTYNTWQEGKEKGYTLYRKEWSENGENGYGKLIQRGVLPKDSDFWVSLPDTGYAEVARRLHFETLDPLTVDSLRAELSLALALQMSNMDAQIAEAMGMLFEDKTTKKGKRYLYALVLGHRPAEFVEVYTDSLTHFIAPELYQKSFSDSLASFSWAITDPLLQSALVVERSDDGQKTWHRISEAPILVQEERDTLGRELANFSQRLPKLYYSYYYRARAITPFGDLSEPSHVAWVYGYHDRIPVPELRAENLNNEKVRLDWQFPDTMNANIRGFYLLRSPMPDSAYTILSIVPREARSFTDSLPLTEAYYQLVLSDWVGENHYGVPEFVQIEDFVPPKKPLWKRPEVDKSGRVKLAWKGNREQDFAGYSLFFSESPDSEFSILTDSLIRDTTFTDRLALNLLNKKVYYTLVAYDLRLNASVHADTLEIVRPDTIPPAPANFRDYALTDSTVYLAWANSPSSDVEFTLLTRRADGDSSACILALFYPNANEVLNHFVDETGDEGKEYTYALCPKDYAHLWAEPAEISLATTFSGVRRAIEDLEFEYFAKEKKIQLSWPIPQQKVKRYTLYRKGPEDAYLGAYKVFDGKYGSFIDKGLKVGELYEYCISALLEDGSKTAVGRVSRAILPKPDEE